MSSIRGLRAGTDDPRVTGLPTIQEKSSNQVPVSNTWAFDAMRDPITRSGD